MINLFFILMMLINILLIECNGSGVNLIKVGAKRRRTRGEILEEKEE